MPESEIPLRKNAVALWLYTGLVMLIIQVLLGGITRLTGSGLSITEWKPILGALPPLSEKAWQEAFLNYQQIGQFKNLNSHFTLADFKSIYFWEWFHREWARLIGLVFIVPFIYFLAKKRIGKNMIQPLIILFLLGFLQAMIGWIMVKSGLNLTSLYVDHIRLAIHFIAAVILLTYLLWFALKISVPPFRRKNIKRLKKVSLLLVLLIFVQLTYGAFMAGSHAALAAPNWPDINGQWFPANMFQSSFFESISQNLLAIQFIHRGLAYLILSLVIIQYFMLKRSGRSSEVFRFRFWPLILTLLQIALGIAALLNVLQPFAIVLNVFHQLVGMLLLLSVVITLFLSKRASF